MVTRIVAFRRFRLAIFQYLRFIFLSNESFHRGIHFIGVDRDWGFDVSRVVYLIYSSIAILLHILDGHSLISRGSGNIASWKIDLLPPVQKSSCPCSEILLLRYGCPSCGARPHSACRGRRPTLKHQGISRRPHFLSNSQD